MVELHRGRGRRRGAGGGRGEEEGRGGGREGLGEGLDFFLARSADVMSWLYDGVFCVCLRKYVLYVRDYVEVSQEPPFGAVSCWRWCRLVLLSVHCMCGGAERQRWR